MAESKRKLKSGASKSEVFAMRLDPKLKYLAELAARKQRRSLGNFVEWAIEEVLGRYPIEERPNFEGEDEPLMFINAGLWDIDEPTRFAKLAFRHPDLLTYDEQVIWKLICENGLLWRGDWKGSDGTWSWRVREEGLILERLREYWEIFKAVAAGEQPQSSLPRWASKKSESTSSKNGGDTFEDDDIPF